MELRPITTRMLAKEAGISQSTVSRALKGDPRIAEQTRKRIREIADKMGYVPDPRLSALSTYCRGLRSHRGDEKIAIWNVRTANEPMPNPVTRVMPGIRRRAGELGYTTEVYSYSHSPEDQRRLSKILYAQGVRGVLIGALPVEHHDLDAFEWNKFSAVALTYSLRSPQLHFVAQDHAERCHMVYTKLREMGYRKIGFCGRIQPEVNNRHLQVGAYLRSLYLDGLVMENSPPLIYDQFEDLDLIPWVKKHRFDAIMAMLPAEIIDQLTGAGYKVPGDIGVAGVAIPAGSTRPNMHSGGVQDMEQLGVIAVDVLHQQICHGYRGIPEKRLSTLLEGVWNPGETVCPQPANPRRKNRTAESTQ